MIYRDYGATGVKVSAVGFGGMRFRNFDDVEASAGLVKAAHDAGVNYFDTAPGYGASEDLFGAAFKTMLPTRTERPFYVSTKSNKADPGELRRDVETSLKRMGLEWIDFLHMWCVMSLENYRQRQANGVLREMEKLRDEGLVRHLCISSHMTGDDIGVVLRDYPFDGVLLGYSVMNYAYREAGIEAAAALGRGVVVMNPLGGGIIPRHAERFRFVTTQENETVVEGALRFLFNDPRITVALVGVSDEAQLRDAVKAVDGFRPLSDEAVTAMREGLRESFDHMCTGCGYCLPCPEEIPVPRMMEAYNHYMMSGDEKDMFNRLRWHWGEGLEEGSFRRCIECGACEARCTQKLPIVPRLDEMREAADRALAAQAKKQGR